MNWRNALQAAPIVMLAVALYLLITRTPAQGGPQPKTKGIEFMYIVKDDNPPVGYSLTVGAVSDAEGNVIENAKLSVEVASDNPAAVSVLPNEDPKTGSISFGSPGSANVTASVKDEAGNILATGSASFLVTTGDPKSVSGVGLAFEGLTEASA